MHTPKAPRGVSRRTLIGLVAAAIVAPHVARAAVRVARFGHNLPDESHYGRGATAFAQAVAADPTLSSVLKVEVYGNGQLGEDLSLANSCIKGTVDGALIGNSVMSNLVPEVGVLNAPYLFRDVTQARAVLDGPVGVELAELSHAKNLPVLAWGENGMRQVTSNVPVRTVADLRGLKIRVPQSEVMLSGFKALGANAGSLALGLTPNALRTGEFQAQENGIALIESLKLWDVQKYLCLTGHVYDGTGFIASPDLLEDLTEPQRVALAACAQKGAVLMRELSAAAAKDGIGRLKTAGMTVIDDVDTVGLRAAARPYIESLGGTYGVSLVKRLLAAGA